MTDMPVTIYAWDNEQDGQRWTQSSLWDYQAKYIRIDQFEAAENLISLLKIQINAIEFIQHDVSCALENETNTHALAKDAQELIDAYEER